VSRTRVGVLGGTFDPFHNGHAEIARAVRDAGLVDLIVVVPANDPWQKRCVATANQRLEMVRLGITGREGIQVSDIDIVRGGSTYTVDTLSDIAVLYPDADVSFIVGSDAAAGLPTWHRADELRASTAFIVVTRPGALQPQLDVEGYDLNLLVIPPVDVSSSAIRERVSKGLALTGMVPSAVAEYIMAQGLYRE
jgi:nicotinate-nucleotide adenylyltransferase